MISRFNSQTTAGEKLFEELKYEGENFSVTSHPKIMRFTTQPYPLALVRKRLQQLTTELPEAEPNRTKCAAERAVPEYNPYLMEPEWEFGITPASCLWWAGTLPRDDLG